MAKTTTPGARRLFALLSVIFSVFFISSCSGGDDDGDGGEKKDPTDQDGGGNSSADGNSSTDGNASVSFGQIAKITQHSWYTDGYKKEDDGDETYEFSYDGQNRLVRIVHTEVDEVAYNNGYTGPREKETTVTTMDIAYAADKVSYEITTTVDGVAQKVKPSGSITLKDGRAVSGECIDYDEKDPGRFSKYTETYTLTYDANGYLVKTTRTEDGEAPEDIKITWANGNPELVVWGYTGNTQLVDRATYGSVRNQGRFDLNWFLALDSEGWDFSTGDPYKIFALLGYIGKRSANLADSMTDGAEVLNWGNRTYNYAYELDESCGLPVKMTRTQAVGYGTECEYTIVYK